jgi:hypothetical protein
MNDAIFARLPIFASRQRIFGMKNARNKQLPANQKGKHPDAWDLKNTTIHAGPQQGLCGISESQHGASKIHNCT